MFFRGRPSCTSRPGLHSPSSPFLSSLAFTFIAIEYPILPGSDIRLLHLHPSCFTFPLSYLYLPSTLFSLSPHTHTHPKRTPSTDPNRLIWGSVDGVQNGPLQLTQIGLFEVRLTASVHTHIEEKDSPYKVPPRQRLSVP